MNKKHLDSLDHIRNIVTMALAFGCMVAAHADSAFSRPIKTLTGPSGLLTTVYHLTASEAPAGVPTLSTLTSVVDYMNGTSPNYAFVNKTLGFNYSGTNATSTSTFLGTDAAGAGAADSTALAGTIIDQRGYIYISQAATYQFTLQNSSDLVAVFIGGDGSPGSGNLLDLQNSNNSIGSAPGLPNPVHVDFYETAGGAVQTGWYPIEIVYYKNTGVGSASLSFAVSNQPVQYIAYTPSGPLPIHEYSFTSTNSSNTVFDTAPVQSDEANGALVGAATIANGTLVTHGDAGGTAAANLPTYDLSLFTGSFTIEQWFTRADTVNNYQTLFCFGTDTQHYLIAHPSRGDSGGPLSVDFNSGTGETSLRTTAPGANVETLLTVTYNAVTNVASIYINGSLAATNTVLGGFNLAQIDSAAYSGINGQSTWHDPSFNGTTDEFRFIRFAINQDEITQDYLDGPNQVVPTVP